MRKKKEEFDRVGFEDDPEDNPEEELEDESDLLDDDYRQPEPKRPVKKKVPKLEEAISPSEYLDMIQGSINRVSEMILIFRRKYKV